MNKDFEIVGKTPNKKFRFNTLISKTFRCISYKNLHFYVNI